MRYQNCLLFRVFILGNIVLMLKGRLFHRSQVVVETHLVIVVMAEVVVVEMVIIDVEEVELETVDKEMDHVVIGIVMVAANIRTTRVVADTHMSVRYVMVIIHDHSALKG